MWLELQIFGFRALWSPYFLMYIVLLSLLYFLITGPLRHRFGQVDRPTSKQQVYFYTGMILLYLVKGSPVDLLSHMMLTAHMIQMGIYLLIIPILLLKGIPAWIWRKVVELPVVRPVFNILSKPLVALLIFNLCFSLYHMPFVFDFSKSSRLAHASISIVMRIAALLMWWNVFTPLKERKTLQPLLRMLYMVANAALITPACVLIIFSSTPLFAAYSSEGAWLQALSLCVPGNVLDGLSLDYSSAELFSPMSTVADQQLGAIIMKVISEFVYGSIIGTTFFKWSKSKKDSDRIDPLPEQLTHSHQNS